MPGYQPKATKLKKRKSKLNPQPLPPGGKTYA
jgi:hypothetical protein